MDILSRAVFLRRCTQGKTWHTVDCGRNTGLVTRRARKLAAPGGPVFYPGYLFENDIVLQFLLFFSVTPSFYSPSASG